MALTVGHSGDEELRTEGDTSAPTSTPVLTELRTTFEGFGLNGYEAQVLLALLQLDSTTARELARVANIGRTHVYPVLEALRDRGLARQLVGKLSIWQSPGREEVLDRLCAAEEARLKSLGARKQQARHMLERLVTQQSVATPYVHTLAGASQVTDTYYQLLAEAAKEILMFTVRPYSSLPAGLDPAVLDAVERGVSIRVLYIEEEYRDASSAPLRKIWAEYHRRGVQGRLTAELPMKLMISDRRAVLHTLTDPVLPMIGFPSSQLTRHPGFASFLAAAFESHWSASRTRADP